MIGERNGRIQLAKTLWGVAKLPLSDLDQAIDE